MTRLDLALLAGLPLMFAAGWSAHGYTSPGVPAAAARTVAPVPPVTPAAGAPLAAGEASLFYRPFNPGAATPGGAEAGALLAGCLQGETPRCDAAITRYTELEAQENFGGEYTALRWVAELLVADEATRAERLTDVEAARFYRVLSPNDWKALRTWMGLKYDLRSPAFTMTGLTGADTARWVDEFVRFNSPYRDQWEHSSEIVDLVDPKPGMAIADIGAGSGFFTFRFAERVGPTGKAYGVELDEGHLAYMTQVKQQEQLANLEVVRGSETGTGLPKDSVDVVFLCSTYQSVYAMSRAPARRAWIESLKESLRPGGRIVISENTPDGEIPGLVPYRGISLSRSVVVPQLEAYGFRVVSEARFIPQRYLLVLEEAAG